MYGYFDIDNNVKFLFMWVVFSVRGCIFGYLLFLVVLKIIFNIRLKCNNIIICIIIAIRIRV